TARPSRHGSTWPPRWKHSEYRPSPGSGGKVNAEVFLFDEPLSNLDAQLRGELRIELRRLHDTLGRTMVYVTHDQVEAMTLADRIVVMKDGVIQQVGTPDDVYARPANLFVAGFVGAPPMNRLEGDLQGTALTLGGGRQIDMQTYPFAAAPRGGRTVLGLRPEQIFRADGPVPEGAQTIDIRVAMTERLGASSVIWGEAGDLRLCYTVPGADHAPPGTEQTIFFFAGAASLFDAASGRRL
ncbi:ABC transporter ATP-binding protein, partial [Mangrovicoccus sp. HB161399]|uniref:ABC transporter ATP-binding protein n=1 Tax=Mangrovicoccus sp. HB161399 TaxID=2720392 RepID=UPI00352DAD9F